MKIFFFHLCLCLAYGFISCKNHKLVHEFELFTEKEVVVPLGMRQIVAGQDSVMMNPNVGVTRLIVWVDSVACSSCRLSQMSQYNEIIRYSYETEGKFVPIFLFSPPRVKIHEVTLTLKIVRFNHPVFLDEKGLFLATNPQIPADNRFHTFLLDRNGKVVLVGDPVNNPQLWELYKTTITQLIENGGTLPPPEK